MLEADYNIKMKRNETHTVTKLHEIVAHQNAKQYSPNQIFTLKI